jgi:hypothetical protein
MTHRKVFFGMTAILIILLFSCQPTIDIEIEDYENFALYPVRQGSKYGYIDNKGNVIIKPQFELALDFREGLAAVRKNVKMGYISKRGELVIEPKFYEAGSFSEGIAAIDIKSN